ncbi:MAG: MATE family efflux transporter [Lentimicrobiaceae bacterium]|nr:MATE family efflux transporter [Lentimicrobiaceae bacterium]MCP4909866.1 MATE family efflux transporter [Bacteroidota bacterium]MBT3455070.1 MATE family efflux transporter [Lentimicrobiaceae bacterium]MBT3818186.1 MATE family efflux transporter [Lentimicrobiaceae bacterium]MBT4061732.1 MATE family efflux transporter [Lentimicrobiaceae bacterium]
MKDLTTGKEGNKILNFALPMLLGNVFQQMYNIVDSIIVGKVLGDEALAAVGANFPFIFALISFVVGIAIGATVIISQYYGAKQMDNVKKTIDTLYIFMFFASVFITTVGILMSGWIFQIIDLPNSVKPMAIEYFKVYAIGFIFFFGFQGTSAILRGLGDSKTPVYFLIISTIMNIALDILFVVVFKWGIEGVAAATVISQAGAFFTIIWYLNRYHSFMDFSPSKMRFDKSIFKKSLKIGLPSGVQQTFVSLGFLALYRIVNIFGVPTIAAYTIAMRIDSFAVMPAMNFSAAISTFVGQNIGANKFERLGRGLKSTLLMINSISLMITIIALLFAGPLISMFTDSQEVVNIGKQYIYIVTPFYIVFSTMFIFNGLLRGAGATLIPMIITILALWGIRVPISWLLSNEIGSNGIWWGIPIAWIFGVISVYIYYLSGKWKKNAVVKHGNADD